MDTAGKKPRKEVASFMRRLYQKGLTTSLGGNISLKEDGFIYITASQNDKASIKSKAVGILNEEGHNLTPNICLSMETGMHLAIYHQQLNAQAIIHAHPPFASAFAAAHHDIDTRLTGEAYAVAGTAIQVPYALAGSSQLASLVAEASEKGSVMLLQNHGVLAWGSSLLEAFDKIEVIENAARIHLSCKLLNAMNPLSPEHLNEIDQWLKQ